MKKKTDFVRCPECRAMIWEDLHSLMEGVDTRFRCIRCGTMIYPGKCRGCSKKKWQRLSHIVEKDGKKPVVRFECLGCSRIIGFLLD
jgi:uncharacterized protein CbrC (UPF0167 family)